MLPHQVRVLEEEKALGEKVDSLGKFLHTPTFLSLGEAEQRLLITQLWFMIGYERVLNDRISLWETASSPS